jgi:peptidoglycan/xylan/chitin deacetylase (PgdA/CDA1 family)
VEATIRWPNGAQCAVMLTFDVDGPTRWISLDPRVWDWPKPMSMGAYGPWRGLPRILDLLEEHAVAGTFFVPGWVAEQWPERFREIDRCGHEVGHHGYLHETFFDRGAEEQLAIIERTQRVYQDLMGKSAVGFRVPSGELGPVTTRLLLETGFSYSSSIRGDDRPYRLTVDGRPSELIEIPARWELVDFPQFAYCGSPPMPKGLDRVASHAGTLDLWQGEFDGYYRFGLCYVITLHPQLSGMPGRALLLDRLIRHIKGYPGVWFARGAEIAAWWRQSETDSPRSGPGAGVAP